MTLAPSAPSWADIKISFNGIESPGVVPIDCRESIEAGWWVAYVPKQSPTLGGVQLSPPRYESKGTWFERKPHVPRYFGVVASVDSRGRLDIYYSVRTYGRINKVETTISIKADDSTPITTPAGKQTTLGQAVGVVDFLTKQAGTLCGYGRENYSPAMNADVVARSISNLTGMLETHRRERDDARREARQAKAEAEELTRQLAGARAALQGAQEGSTYLRSKLDAVNAVVSSFVGRPERRGQGFEDLSEFHARITEALHRSMPIAGTSFRGSAERAPVVTADTPVTLGMLREISGEASRINDERWDAKREVNAARWGGTAAPRSPTMLEEYGCTPMQVAIDRKLGR